MSFNEISYIELWWPFCSAAEWNHLSNFGRDYHEEKYVKLF